MANTAEGKKKAPKAPKDRQVKSAKNWRRNSAEDLELPSGNVARVRRPGPTKLLTSGIMPDSLMPIINEGINKGKGLPPAAEKALVESPQQLAEMMEGVDRAMLLIVVEPAVAFHRREKRNDAGEVVKDIDTGKPVWEDIPEDERDPDAFIYTDEIDDDDKMFLFNYAVGGTRDLERFRQEHSARMGDLADHSTAGSASE